MRQIDAIELEIRKGTREIEFDTHGLTDECPWFENVDFEECCRCVYYRGYAGFTVFCKYDNEEVE